ncbi:hypothetical protein ILYODFUR_031174 [Ilyodon furcidens]|uniref:Uncharacterized protein n=1 Tax=Ilyodon furcidens TaxID=33524 RepID=A0ABV0TFG4_9TELE
MGLLQIQSSQTVCLHVQKNCIKEDPAASNNLWCPAVIFRLYNPESEICSGSSNSSDFYSLSFRRRLRCFMFFFSSFIQRNISDPLRLRVMDTNTGSNPFFTSYSGSFQAERQKWMDITEEKLK